MLWRSHVRKQVQPLDAKGIADSVLLLVCLVDRLSAQAAAASAATESFSASAAAAAAAAAANLSRKVYLSHLLLQRSASSRWALSLSLSLSLLSLFSLQIIPSGGRSVPAPSIQASRRNTDRASGGPVGSGAAGVASKAAAAYRCSSTFVLLFFKNPAKIFELHAGLQMRPSWTRACQSEGSPP